MLRDNHKFSKYKTRYLLAGGSDQDHLFRNLDNYTLSKVYKKLYKDLQTGGMTPEGGENFPRNEPHLQEGVVFNVKQHSSPGDGSPGDGTLSDIPKLNKFLFDPKTNLTQEIDSLKALICVLYLIKNYKDDPFDKINPGDLEFIWNTTSRKILFKAVFKDKPDGGDKKPTEDLGTIDIDDPPIIDDDILKSAKLILYVKTYIHPRWIIKTNVVGDKVRLLVNDYNSFQGAMGHKQTDFRAIRELLVANSFYSKLINGELINIYIDTSGVIQRLQFNVKENKIRPLPEIANQKKRPNFTVPATIPDWTSKQGETIKDKFQVASWKDGKGEGKKETRRNIASTDILIPRSDLCRRALFREYFKGVNTKRPIIYNQLAKTMENIMAINKRPVCFFGPFDITITRDKEYFLGSSNHMLENLNELADPNLYNTWAEKNGYNTYTDMLYSSLCIVAEQTQFINSADRYSGGLFKKLRNPCHLLFTVGFRGELPGTPEYSLMTNREGQLNQEKFRIRCLITLNLVKDYIIKHHREYSELTPCVCVTGIGIGVWALDMGTQKKILQKVSGEVFRNVKVKVNDRDTKTLEARYLYNTFDPPTDLELGESGWEVVKEPVKSLEPGDLVEQNIDKYYEPGDLVEQNTDKYYYFIFAGDGNSQRGNEGLFDFNCQSGDPQYLTNSILPGSWPNNKVTESSEPGIRNLPL